MRGVQPIFILTEMNLEDLDILIFDEITWTSSWWLDSNAGIERHCETHRPCADPGFGRDSVPSSHIPDAHSQRQPVRGAHLGSDAVLSISRWRSDRVDESVFGDSCQNPSK